MEKKTKIYMLLVLSNVFYIVSFFPVLVAAFKFAEKINQGDKTFYLNFLSKMSLLVIFLLGIVSLINSKFFGRGSNSNLEWLVASHRLSIIIFFINIITITLIVFLFSLFIFIN